MVCLTGLYSRDITNMIFVTMHLNVSCLSACSSCSLIPERLNMSLFVSVCRDIWRTNLDGAEEDCVWTFQWAYHAHHVKTRHWTLHR